jgi:hypothetical protein
MPEVPRGRIRRHGARVLRRAALRREVELDEGEQLPTMSSPEADSRRGPHQEGDVAAQARC